MLATSGKAFVFGRYMAGMYEVVKVNPRGDVETVKFVIGSEVACIKAVATVCDETGAIYGGVEASERVAG